MRSMAVCLVLFFLIGMDVLGLIPEESNSHDVLYLVAYTIEFDNKCKNVRITIEEEGEVVDSIETNWRGVFRYSFKANTYYKIYLSKYGYETKCIDINTYTHKLVNNPQEFIFNVEMSKGSEDVRQEVAKIYFPRKGKKVRYSKL